MNTDFDNIQTDTMEGDNVEVLRNLFTGSMTQSLSSLLLHTKLDLLPANINDTCSRVLGDGFHFKDRVKVPMHHSYEKSNYVSLREVFFSWNPSMHTTVKNSLMNNEGMSESEIEMHLHHNLTWWSARIHRSILPPSLLHWRVRAIIVFYRDKHML